MDQDSNENQLKGMPLCALCNFERICGLTHGGCTVKCSSLILSISDNNQACQNLNHSNFSIQSHKGKQGNKRNFLD